MIGSWRDRHRMIRFAICNEYSSILYVLIMLYQMALANSRPLIAGGFISKHPLFQCQIR
jgi:hypothetical protein